MGSQPHIRTNQHSWQETGHVYTRRGAVGPAGVCVLVVLWTYNPILDLTSEAIAEVSSDHTYSPAKKRRATSVRPRSASGSLDASAPTACITATESILQHHSQTLCRS